MRALTLDIETIPGQDPLLREDLAAGITPPGNMSKPETIAAWERDKKPGLIEEAWRKTSFDGAYCQIVCIGSALGDDRPLVLHSKPEDKVLTLAAEAQLIRAFYASLELLAEPERMGLLWVGHNIVDFDLRVIYQRSVIHGIRPPSWIPFHDKPWGGRIFDTMTAWAGVKGRISQDKLCRVLGIDSKGSELGDEIDGSRVWDFVKEGRIKDVATYCGADVERARKCYRRMNFLADTPALRVAV